MASGSIFSLRNQYGQTALHTACKYAHRTPSHANPETQREMRESAIENVIRRVNGIETVSEGERETRERRAERGERYLTCLCVVFRTSSLSVIHSLLLNGAGTHCISPLSLSLSVTLCLSSYFFFFFTLHISSFPLFLFTFSFFLFLFLSSLLLLSLSLLG